MDAKIEEFLKHFGTKGMKWGVRKAKDEINSTSRTIKKGTTIQNITSRKFDEKSTRHMYAAYTSYDKTAYTDMMGNYMYNEKGFKNEFKVKKDIKIPSDKELVDTFTAIVKNNPKLIAKEMTNAYNELSIFSSKKVKHFEKKLSQVDGSNIKKGEKLTQQYVSLMVSDKAAKSRAELFGGLIKKGYDGMSDINDRNPNAGAQDPLIIFKPAKTLGKVKSVKLEKAELDSLVKLTTFDKAYAKQRLDLSEIQR